MALICKFNCPACGLQEEEVEVPARPNANTSSLIPWIHNTVMPIVAGVHRTLRPQCKAKACDLMLPVTDQGIGLPGRELTPEEREELKESIARSQKKE